jgi:hypothetical protein
MISGTTFTIEEPEFVSRACRGMRPGVATASEIAEVQAECEANRALCLACEDGMVVVNVCQGTEGLEMFVWLAVAFKHGAVARQGPALDKIGRDLGAKTIAFAARRRGWARALGPEWRRRGTCEFVRSVN